MQSIVVARLTENSTRAAEMGKGGYLIYNCKSDTCPGYGYTMEFSNGSRCVPHALV